MKDTGESSFSEASNTAQRGSRIGFNGSTGGFLRKVDQLLKSIVEKLMASVLLILAAPLFIVIPIAIKLQDGGPVLFRSRRLGKSQQIFYMYKFRSLALDAEQKVGGQLLHHSHNLETPIGGFLRDTRLDEIPQLINVVLGHMQFIGPRPERPSVYEQQCAHLPGYQKRFKVKPGLFGYAQIFTPHSTPKRIRVMIDNRHIDRNENFVFSIVWILGAVIFMAFRACRRIWGTVNMRAGFWWKGTHPVDRRTLKRIRPQGVKVNLRSDSVEEPNVVEIADINDEFMLLYSGIPLSDSLGINLEMKTCDRLRARRRGKIARVDGIIRRSHDNGIEPFKYSYIVKYEAASPFNQYLVDKYLLRNSIA